MKRIAAMLMFLLAPIAFAGQALLAYGSGEVNAETRLQHQAGRPRKNPPTD